MNLGRCKCIECGYLCFEIREQRFIGELGTGIGLPGVPQYEFVTDYREITSKERNGDIKVRRSSKNLFCYRREVSFERELESALKSENASLEVDNIIKKVRKCRYYSRYIPSYSPSQHLTKCEVDERERSTRRWSLLYILIGAVITGVGALAIKLIFK